MITNVTIEHNGTYSNGCDKHTVRWVENGTTKERHFQKIYTAQRLARWLTDYSGGLPYFFNINERIV
jgi:hypothetical protein